MHNLQNQQSPEAYELLSCFASFHVFESPLATFPEQKRVSELLQPVGERMYTELALVARRLVRILSVKFGVIFFRLKNGVLA